MVRMRPLLALVKSRCDAKRWTFAEAAGKAKMSVAGLRKLCAGKVLDPRSTTVHDVAQMLGVEPARVRAAIEAGRKG